MSAGKRPASNSFGSSQMVVKRQKSNADLNNHKAVAVTNGGTGNGALVQAVSHLSFNVALYNGLVLNEVSKKAG